jgi:hypothetical protein
MYTVETGTVFVGLTNKSFVVMAVAEALDVGAVIKIVFMVEVLSS